MWPNLKNVLATYFWMLDSVALVKKMYEFVPIPVLLFLDYVAILVTKFGALCHGNVD